MCNKVKPSALYACYTYQYAKVIAVDFNCYFDPLRDREDPQFGKIITNDDREKQAQSQKDHEDAENSKYVYRDDYDDFQVSPRKSEVTLAIRPFRFMRCREILLVGAARIKKR